VIDPQVQAAFEALEAQGWKGTPSALAAAIKRLNYGLPAEDEFSLLLSWLGKCRLVHRLGQEQTPPGSMKTYRVPDLLAVFDYKGKATVVLIEVKSSRKPTLSWREDYFLGLTRYGEALRLPVLLAWKQWPVGIWTLVDLQCFRRATRNYHLDFSTAIKNSLMGVLAGDFAMDFAPGLAMHIKMKKLDRLSEERWHLQVDEAYFENAQGRRFTKLKGGLWPFLLTLDSKEDQEETETHFHLSFVVRKESSMQFAHRAFPGLLRSPSTAGEPRRWRQLLREHHFPITPTSLRTAAQEASSNEVVKRFIRVVPQTTPAFLGKRVRPTKA
jgi:Holliday junction resolvase